MSRGAGLAALTALGLAVRLAGIGSENLWIDEVNSVTVSRGTPLGLAERMRERGEAHPPLYYLVLSCWMAVAGEGDAAVRIPSALLGSLAVPLAAGLASVLRRGTWAAAGLVAALSPVMVTQAQEARMYPLLAASAGAALVLLLSGPHGPPRSALLALATAAMLYTHFMGLFLGAALGLVALAAHAASLRARLARAAPLVAGLVLFAPWLLVIVSQWSETQQYFGWNRTQGLPLQVLRLAPYVVLGDPPAMAPGVRAAQAVVVLLGAAGAAALLGDAASRSRTVLLLAAMALPVAQVVAVAALRAPIFHRRYFSLLAVPAAVLVGEGAVAAGAFISRRGPALRHAPLGLLALGLLAWNAARLATPDHMDARAVAAALDAEVPSGDLVLHVAPGGLPQESFLLLRHYRPSYRHCLVPWDGRAFSRETAGYVGAACTFADLASACAGRARATVVLTGAGVSLLSPGQAGARAVDLLERELPPGWRIARQRSFHLVRLLELEGPAGP